jgi:simple sugar transport system ATP-binding protein
MPPVTIAIKDITKAYPGTLACHHVSLECYPGEIHALLGGNGAGKSTLVKILAGMIVPESGSIEIGGRPVRFAGPKQSQTAGIGVIHQAGSLIDTLTVGENLQIALAVSQGGARGENGSSLQPILPLDLPMERLVQDLSPRQRRLLELHRLLTRHVDILVLDEPTATLAPQESDLFFQDLRTLANAGATIIVVSHKLPEVLAYSDRFTVMRKGRICARLTRAEASAERLQRLLTEGNGLPAEAQADSLPPSYSAQAGPVVTLRGVSTYPSQPHESALASVDLMLRRGEVLGVAGHAGSGITTLFQILIGQRARITHGCVDWGDGPADYRSIGYIPANGQAAGCVGAMTVAINLAFRRRALLTWRNALGRRSPLNRFAQDMIRRFRIQPPDPRLAIESLSGGNAQKVLLAREIEYATDLLLAVNPTTGLDCASAKAVRAALRAKAESDAAVVIHSDDLDELVGFVDRVVVLSRGRVTGDFTGHEMTREAVGWALAELSPRPARAQHEPITGQRSSMTCNE